MLHRAGLCGRDSDLHATGRSVLRAHCCSRPPNQSVVSCRSHGLPVHSFVHLSHLLFPLALYTLSYFRKFSVCFSDLSVSDSYSRKPPFFLELPVRDPSILGLRIRLAQTAARLPSLDFPNFQLFWVGLSVSWILGLFSWLTSSCCWTSSESHGSGRLCGN